MFDRIQSFNRKASAPFSAVLDTLTVAETYFGSLPEHSTTPRLLMDLARRFPDVHFIGAHMGGLAAPFETLEEALQPVPNLSLDTSNAAHTLSEGQFTLLLRRFGPEHILFGTDWPWFLHENEIDLANSRMETAGFSKEEKQAVFYGNAEKILGLDSAI
ncbi:MAG: amidohydrolase family protein, partial [Acidobacteriota bacterium]